MATIDGLQAGLHARDAEVERLRVLVVALEERLEMAEADADRLADGVLSLTVRVFEGGRLDRALAAHEAALAARL